MYGFDNLKIVSDRSVTESQQNAKYVTNSKQISVILIEVRQKVLKI
jgi:hypothetical protein